jgi:hypothetical protein
MADIHLTPGETKTAPDGTQYEASYTVISAADGGWIPTDCFFCNDEVTPWVMHFGNVPANADFAIVDSSGACDVCHDAFLAGDLNVIFEQARHIPSDYTLTLSYQRASAAFSGFERRS